MVVKLGPQPDGKVEGVTVNPEGLLKVRTTVPETGGAHLNESVAEPVPPVIVTGFIDQRAFEELVLAKPTAA